MYQRFLNNHDYIGVMSPELFGQMTRGNQDAIDQAEEAAEANLLEYLSDNYEIERELAVGKNLREYSPLITYPVGAHFYLDGKIVEALRSINGYKAPALIDYWEEYTDCDERKLREARPYSQLLNYQPGEIVRFGNRYWICREPNGFDFNDIRIPGVNAWEKLEVYLWVPNLAYNLWDVVKWQGQFYTLIKEPQAPVLEWLSSDTSIFTVDDNGLVTAVGVGSATLTAQVGKNKATCQVRVSENTLLPATLANFTTQVIGDKITPLVDFDGNVLDMGLGKTYTMNVTVQEEAYAIDLTVNPYDSDNWGLIGDYDATYAFSLNEHEYVVFEDNVFYPVMSPSADELKQGYNYRLHDPRNGNLKKHMVRIALYELHKLISPNNISSSRITDYETSITWLRDANRCKINPQIPRKLDDERKPVSEIAIATFQRDYDPYKNPWQI